MNPYVLLAAVVGFVAALGGAYWQGRSDGEARVQVQWDEAKIAAASLADAERKKDQAKAQALSKRQQAQLATQRQTSRALAEQLDAALKSQPIPAACVISDGVRDAINAGLSGKSAAGTVVPATSRGVAPVKDPAN